MTKKTKEIPNSVEKDGRSTRKGGKKFTKFNGKDKDRTFEKPYTKGPNDIGWRTADEAMAKAVGSIPYGVAAGLPQDVEETSYYGLVTKKFRQPGVLGIGTMITLGNSRNYNDAINLAARKIYSFVRHANSGSRNYEAADLALYLGALGQPLAYLGFLQRLYLVLTKYSVSNRYQPKALVRAMGVKYDDVIQHIAELRYLILWLGRSIGSLAFPDLPYYRACYEAFQFIFKDNDSPKEQLYLMYPTHLGYYNPIHSTDGGGLEYAHAFDPEGGSGETFADLNQWAHNMMDVLLSDEDCGIISGDILKAYQDSGLFQPAALTDESEIIIDSPEFKQQVHNLQVVSYDDAVLEDYHQVAGTANTAPYIVEKITATALPEFDSFISIPGAIDAFSRDPDFKETINCTVLKPQCTLLYDEETDGCSIKTDSLTFDFFLPTEVILVRFKQATGTLVVTDITKAFRAYYCAGFTAKFPSAIREDVLRVTNFDWHPMMYFNSPESGENEVFVLADIQNIRFLNYDVYQKIHNNSILSMLGFENHNFSSQK